MCPLDVCVLFAIHLSLVTAQTSGTGVVTFWKEDFTMTCPWPGKWYKEHESTVGTTGTTWTQKYEDTTEGLYRCEHTSGTLTKTYYFFVRGKVCENCYELSGLVIAMAIAGDVAGTTVLMVAIYKCMKRRAEGRQGQPSKAPPRSLPKDPTAPSKMGPDYDLLNPHNRAQDTYNTVHRMG